MNLNIRTLARPEITEQTEQDFNYYEFFKQNTTRVFSDVPTSVANASVNTAYSANAKAIFAFTTSGSTARLISRLRPEMPIIAMTPTLKAFHQLSLFWGVIPILASEINNMEDAKKKISQFALEKGIVQYGDLVVIIAGTPFGKSGTTNMMIVDSIGDVLVRGVEGWGQRVHGKVMLVASAECPEYGALGKILVIDRCNESYFPLLKRAAGVIFQNKGKDVESESYLKQKAAHLNLSVLISMENAKGVLRNEQLITLDPHANSVYKGIIS